MVFGTPTTRSPSPASFAATPRVSSPPTSSPEATALRTTARMTALRPGQSPPPVRMPMRTTPPGGRSAGQGRSCPMHVTAVTLDATRRQDPPMDPAALLALMPFAVATGIELDRAGPGEVTGRLPWSPERCTAGGVLHG